MLALQATHWFLALVPVLVMLTIFVWFDAFKLMNLKEILVLLVLGGIGAIASYPVSGRLLDTLPIGFSNYSRFVAPWIEEASKGALKGIIGVNRKPLVSIDFNHNPLSSIYDATQTRVMEGTLVKVLSWYDNEWGFSNRMLDMTLAFANAK